MHLRAVLRVESIVIVSPRSEIHRARRHVRVEPVVQIPSFVVISKSHTTRDVGRVALASSLASLARARTMSRTLMLMCSSFTSCFTSSSLISLARSRRVASRCRSRAPIASRRVASRRAVATSPDSRRVPTRRDSTRFDRRAAAVPRTRARAWPRVRERPHRARACARDERVVDRDVDRDEIEARDADAREPRRHSRMSKVKTARDIARKAAEIFGHHVGNGLPSGRKVLRRPMIGDVLAGYYPKSLARSDPLFTAPDETRRRVKLERLRRRGKGPPKKGEGKRASK